MNIQEDVELEECSVTVRIVFECRWVEESK